MTPLQLEDQTRDYLKKLINKEKAQIEMSKKRIAELEEKIKTIEIIINTFTNFEYLKIHRSLKL